MKRWRRPLIVMALLLLAGAVVNVAVAWDSAIRQLPRSGVHARGASQPTGRSLRDTGLLVWGVLRDARAERRVWRTWWPDRPFTTPFPLAVNYNTSSNSSLRKVAGSWGRMVDRSGRLQFGLPDGVEEAHGWPWLTLTGAVVNDESDGQLVHTALVLDDYSISRRPRILPLGPILPGFFYNTLFYTAILALPLSFVPIRRRLRARRGRCPKCGYDRAGLADPAAPCPECGATR